MSLALLSKAYEGPSQTIADATYEGINKLGTQRYIVPQKESQCDGDVVITHAERYRDGDTYVVVAHLEVVK